MLVSLSASRWAPSSASVVATPSSIVVIASAWGLLVRQCVQAVQEVEDLAGGRHGGDGRVVRPQARGEPAGVVERPGRVDAEVPAGAAGRPPVDDERGMVGEQRQGPPAE